MSSEHNLQVQELFLNMTASVSKGMDAHDLRLISLENFTKAIDQMMDKAYYYGMKDGLKSGYEGAAEVMDKVFK